MNCTTGLVTMCADDTGCDPLGEPSCCQSGTDAFSLVLVDSTCSPFHLHFQAGSLCDAFALYGYTDFYIDE